MKLLIISSLRAFGADFFGYNSFVRHYLLLSYDASIGSEGDKHIHRSDPAKMRRGIDLHTCTYPNGICLFFKEIFYVGDFLIRCQRATFDLLHVSRVGNLRLLVLGAARKCAFGANNLKVMRYHWLA